MWRWVIGLGLMVVVGAPAALLAWDAFGPANAAVAHTPLHIGCRHHNHGPKWSADHGRILGAKGAAALGDADAVGDLASRSLTAGRSAKRPRAED